MPGTEEERRCDLIAEGELPSAPATFSTTVSLVASFATVATSGFASTVSDGAAGSPLSSATIVASAW